MERRSFFKTKEKTEDQKEGGFDHTHKVKDENDIWCCWDALRQKENLTELKHLQTKRKEKKDESVQRPLSTAVPQLSESAAEGAEPERRKDPHQELSECKRSCQDSCLQQQH